MSCPDLFFSKLLFPLDYLKFQDDIKGQTSHKENGEWLPGSINFPRDLATSLGSEQPAWTGPGPLAMYITTAYLFGPSNFRAAHDTRGLPLHLTTGKTNFFPALSTTLCCGGCILLWVSFWASGPAWPVPGAIPLC